MVDAGLVLEHDRIENAGVAGGGVPLLGFSGAAVAAASAVVSRVGNCTMIARSGSVRVLGPPTSVSAAARDRG